MSSLIRNSLRRSCHLRRWQSTSAATRAQPSQPSREPSKSSQDLSLPPAKMRALIELYHKSETFITPETLDQAIDEAFINIPEVHMATIAQRDRSREELTKHVTGRRTLAKLGNSQMLEQVQELSGGLYSDTKSEREEKLQAALYGAFRMKPSLETVIEEAYRFQEEKEVEGTKQ